MESYVVAVILVLSALIFLPMLLFTVRQQTAVAIERFGRFVRVAGPGLNIKIPLIERIARVLDLRIQQMVVQIETKTKDNVFVKVHIAVQYFVLDSRLKDAFFDILSALKDERFLGSSGNPLDISTG